ncbi:MAG: TIGR02921 family PEP-CTERM protein [Desulfoprunum sp.]|nr:TIGR02921 family PEP-CTERM protein [Desulfoprunum sp.]
MNAARHLLFWSWNIIFLVFIYLGLVPIIGSDLLYSLRMGTVNKDFVAFFAVVLLIPAISTLFGFIYLRKDSKKLFDLMYCIELPLLVLTLFRIFFLRDLTAGVGFFLSVFTLISLYFGYRLFSLKRASSSADIIGASAFLWGGAWIFLSLAFLIPPMAYGMVEGLKEAIIGLSKISLTELFSSMFSFFFLFIGTIFIIYSSTLFLLFPIVYVYTSFKNWQSATRQHATTNPARVYGTSFATLAAITLLFVLLTKQNHDTVLQKFRNFSGSAVEKTDFIKNEQQYRNALSDIYLAPYRYMGDYSKSNFIQVLYQKTFAVSEESTRWLQTLFNTVARPFFYQGSSSGMANDQRLAEKYYNDFFDASLQEDERDDIRYAVQSTYSREQIDAGLININEKKVYLESQDISITEQGEWANLEIHEVYYNPSDRQEEIFLHLKLPQGAVINGLWLSDDETKKFAAKVAPRGAAQKVYKEISKRNEDPALAEQVGPQLYRLRVFPIPANDLRIPEKHVMHMWLSLRMVKQNESAWQLPVLTEKRNLYWDAKTKCTLDGNHIQKNDEWLPEMVPFKGSSAPVHLVQYIEDRSIEMLPFHTPETSPEPDCSLAVVIDGSLSMAKRKDEIVAAKNRIDADCANTGVEYFLWHDGVSKIGPDFNKEIEDRLFWGFFDSGDFAQRFSLLQTEKKSVLVITDKTFFRENENVRDYSAIDKPVWFYLTDHKYPRSISDNLLKRLYEIGGNIETRIENALVSINHLQLTQTQQDVVDIDDRYIWRIAKTGERSTQGESSLEPLAAHKLILQSVKYGLTTSNEELDRLQKIAMKSAIISPYSSMIVLVDDAQRKMLEAAEKENDRFDRKVETGKEILTSPTTPFEATAVPEPEEWALIIAVFGFLLIHLYRKGFNPGQAYGTRCNIALRGKRSTAKEEHSNRA